MSPFILPSKKLTANAQAVSHKECGEVILSCFLYYNIIWQMSIEIKRFISFYYKNYTKIVHITD